MAGTEQSAAVYVYGVVPSDVEASGDTKGVGDPPGLITLIKHGEIAALVSEVSPDRPLGTPEDLLAHEELLDATAGEVPVIPLRFGAVMTSSEAVAEEFLAPYHDEFLAALNELDGRAEYIVNGRYVEEAVLREFVRENPDIARLREEISGKPEDATRDVRIQLGELVNQAIEAKRAADTQTLVDAIAPLCVLTVVRDPTHELDAVNTALLVEDERQDELGRKVDELAGQWSGRVDLRLRGPLAPYDFVTATEAQEAG